VADAEVEAIGNNRWKQAVRTGTRSSSPAWRS